MNQQFMHMCRSFFLAILLAGTLPGLSNAQSRSATQAPPTRDQAYLRDLISLTEIIGSAHAVRARCNGPDDQYWRTYMIQILGLEAPLQSNLRAQMVSGFNRGYERENSVRIGCDSTANEREAKYAVDGQRLAASLAAFYFPERENGVEFIPEQSAPEPGPRIRTRQ